MAQRLLIMWDRGKVSQGPYEESFFCKSVEDAEMILDRRNRENIFAAVYFDRVYKFPLISPPYVSSSPSLIDADTFIPADEITFLPWYIRFFNFIIKFFHFKN